MSNVEDFHKRRTAGNEKILKEDFLPFKRFYGLDKLAYQESEISGKYKELMGLVASMALRCNDCISYHIEQSIEAGATRGELNEAMNIALVVGGSIVIPHLRHAFEVIEELDKSKNSELI
ncbi:MAG: carboxymuconolactone decarboxylase family protein [Candidatus Kapabacteria bacterium]|nr:carboxymuconolactone decarboxylase family protein [Candidatus Kapabacteria bacterium]